MMGNPMALELMGKSPISIPVQYAMTYIGLVIMLVSGFFLYTASILAFITGISAGGKWALVCGFAVISMRSPYSAIMSPGLR
jgi:hypothetical protein